MLESHACRHHKTGKSDQYECKLQGAEPLRTDGLGVSVRVVPSGVAHLEVPSGGCFCQNRDSAKAAAPSVLEMAQEVFACRHSQGSVETR